MSDFHSARKILAAQSHRCEHCHAEIEKGAFHWKIAQVWDGDFSAFREHLECRAAWSTLNFDVRDREHSEGAAFLRDDEWGSDDRDWLQEQFPIVYDRMRFAPPAKVEG